MRLNLWAWLVTAAVIMTPASAWSQMGRANFEYEDISKRKTRSTEREARKKKEAEAAKKKAEEEKRRDERRKRWEEDRERREDREEDEDREKSKTSTSKSTSETKGSSKGKPSIKAATMPSTAGGSTDPTARPVTEVMLDAVKTQSVNFSVEEARDNPGVILLNEPKFGGRNRIRAGDYGIGEAL